MNNKPDKLSLGQIVQLEMKLQGFTIHSLAKASGTGVGTIQNLLRQGDDSASSGVHPHVLRSVSEILDLDPIAVFIAAGYINDENSRNPLSSSAYQIGLLFDALPLEQQNILQEIVRGLAHSAGLETKGVHFKNIFEAVERLKAEHPVLAVRSFGVRRQIGLIIGRLRRTTTHELLLKNILERISGSLLTDEVVTKDQIETVCAHSDVEIALNILLQVKEITNSVEKLYWILHESTTAGTPVSDLSQNYRDAFRALWILLKRLAHLS